MIKHGVAGGLGLTFAIVLGLTSMTRPAVAFGADTALIMGGTGVPTPPQSYVDAHHSVISSITLSVILEMVSLDTVAP